MNCVVAFDAIFKPGGKLGMNFLKFIRIVVFYKFRYSRLCSARDLFLKKWRFLLAIQFLSCKEPFKSSRGGQIICPFEQLQGSLRISHRMRKDRSLITELSRTQFMVKESSPAPPV